jgi:hypothetical protein
VDKPVLVCITSTHTIFRFFETFCEHASRSKLRGKKGTHFLDLRIKSYGCLKFQGEVWAGRACAAANEEELTTCANFCGQGGWAGGQGIKIVGHPRRGGRRLLVRAANRAPTSGCPPAAGCSLSIQTSCDCASCGLLIFFDFFFTNFATKTKPPSLNFCKLLLVNLYNP